MGAGKYQWKARAGSPFLMFFTVLCLLALAFEIASVILLDELLRQAPYIFGGYNPALHQNGYQPGFQGGDGFGGNAFGGNAFGGHGFGGFGPYFPGSGNPYNPQNPFPGANGGLGSNPYDDDANGQDTNNPYGTGQAGQSYAPGVGVGYIPPQGGVPSSYPGGSGNNYNGFNNVQPPNFEHPSTPKYNPYRFWYGNTGYYNPWWMHSTPKPSDLDQAILYGQSDPQSAYHVMTIITALSRDAEARLLKILGLAMAMTAGALLLSIMGLFCCDNTALRFALMFISILAGVFLGICIGLYHTDVPMTPAIWSTIAAAGAWSSFILSILVAGDGMTLRKVFLDEAKPLLPQ